MTKRPTEYVVVYDRHLDFCKLFRSDSEDLPSGARILWRGIGLRRGYDEMIRQNKSRRGVEIYRVCSRVARNGVESFKIFKAKPPEGWIEKATASSYGQARAIRSRKVAERDAKTVAALRSIGRGADSAGRLTRSDRLYLRWISEGRQTPIPEKSV